MDQGQGVLTNYNFPNACPYLSLFLDISKKLVKMFDFFFTTLLGGGGVSGNTTFLQLLSGMKFVFLEIKIKNGVFSISVLTHHSPLLKMEKPFFTFTQYIQICRENIFFLMILSLIKWHTHSHVNAPNISNFQTI